VRNNGPRDKQIVQEMWLLANNEPLALAALQPHGFVDRDHYRRYVDGLILELTLETDPHTNLWSYEFAVLHPEGERLDDEIVQHWLTLFFGQEARHAAKRGFMLTTDARFTFPYNRH
jgi:hypothetical protein